MSLISPSSDGTPSSHPPLTSSEPLLSVPTVSSTTNSNTEDLHSPCSTVATPRLRLRPPRAATADRISDASPLPNTASSPPHPLRPHAIETSTTPRPTATPSVSPITPTTSISEAGMPRFPYIRLIFKTTPPDKGASYNSDLEDEETSYNGTGTDTDSNSDDSATSSTSDIMARRLSRAAVKPPVMLGSLNSDDGNAMDSDPEPAQQLQRHRRKRSDGNQSYESQEQKRQKRTQRVPAGDDEDTTEGASTTKRRPTANTSAKRSLKRAVEEQKRDSESPDITVTAPLTLCPATPSAQLHEDLEASVRVSKSLKAGDEPVTSLETSPGTKRKRERKQKTYGGGKGNIKPTTPGVISTPIPPLSPPLENQVRRKRSRPAVKESQQQKPESSSSGPPEGEKSEKRMLRSQATSTKKGEWEELWFEAQEEGRELWNYDEQLPIILIDDDSAPADVVPHAPPPEPQKPSPPTLASSSPLCLGTFDWTAEMASLPSPCLRKPDPLTNAHYTANHLGDVRQEARDRNQEREQLAYRASRYAEILPLLNHEGWQRAIGLSAHTIAQYSPKELDQQRLKMIEYLDNFIKKQKRFAEAERKPKNGHPRRSFSPHGAAIAAVNHSFESGVGGSAKKRRGNERDIDSGDEGSDGANEHASHQRHRNSKSRRLSPAPHDLQYPHPNAPVKKRDRHAERERREARENEFLSFYSRDQQGARMMALGMAGSRRQSGRVLTAFGVNLPKEIEEERDFRLPRWSLEGTRAEQEVGIGLEGLLGPLVIKSTPGWAYVAEEVV